jgi:membrane protein
MRTFDTAIYKQKRKGSIIKKRIKAIRLTMIVLVMFIGTILLSIGQGMLFDKIMHWLKLKGSVVVLIAWLKWVAIIFLFFYSISFIYRFAPSVKKRWPLVTPGAILATFL